MTRHPCEPPDVTPTQREWERLSAFPAKRDAFANDAYVRECWSDAVSVFGSGATDAFERVAVMAFKPDAVVGRRMRTAVEYAIARGFAPLAAAPLAFTRHSMREIWRYDWQVYPVDRLRFSTLWYTSADVLLLAFRDTVPVGGLPATNRLSALKGSALPELRQADSLRTALQPPNQILNFVHVCDEPADIVRELGILVEGEARRDLLRALATDATAGYAATMHAIDTLEARYPWHDLEFDASLARLERAGGVSPVDAMRFRRALQRHETVSWNALSDAVDLAATDTARWDLVCAASFLIPKERDVPAFSFEHDGGREGCLS